MPKDHYKHKKIYAAVSQARGVLELHEYCNELELEVAQLRADNARLQKWQDEWVNGAEGRSNQILKLCLSADPEKLKKVFGSETTKSDVSEV